MSKHIVVGGFYIEITGAVAMYRDNYFSLREITDVFEIGSLPARCEWNGRLYIVDIMRDRTVAHFTSKTVILLD